MWVANSDAYLLLLLSGSIELSLTALSPAAPQRHDGSYLPLTCNYGAHAGSHGKACERSAQQTLLLMRLA